MDIMKLEEVAIQRAYYKETASNYSDMHMDENDEHYFALRFLERLKMPCFSRRI